MNKIEVKELLGVISAVDGRKVEPETVEAWFEVIGQFSYVVAREAVVECRRDPSIMWLEPKHVYARCKAMRDRQTQFREQEARASEEKVSEPCPVCVHGNQLVACLTCCRQIARLAGVEPGKPYPACRHASSVVECRVCPSEYAKKVLN